MLRKILKTGYCKECHLKLELPVNTHDEVSEEYAWSPDSRLVRLRDGKIVGCKSCFDSFRVKHRPWERDFTLERGKEQYHFDREYMKIYLKNSRYTKNPIKKIINKFKGSLKKRLDNRSSHESLFEENIETKGSNNEKRE